MAPASKGRGAVRWKGGLALRFSSSRFSMARRSLSLQRTNCCVTVVGDSGMRKRFLVVVGLLRRRTVRTLRERSANQRPKTISPLSPVQSPPPLQNKAARSRWGREFTWICEGVGSLAVAGRRSPEAMLPGRLAPCSSKNAGVDGGPEPRAPGQLRGCSTPSERHGQATGCFYSPFLGVGFESECSTEGVTRSR